MSDFLMMAIFAGSFVLLWLLLRWCGIQIEAEQ